jgi:RNA polymerase sigma factor (TIGR02999 family)
MRRILIESARRKRALRHGGASPRLNLEDVEIPAAQNDDRLLAVHDALDKLAAQDKKIADLVKLRFFTGLTNKQAAEILRVSEPTVERWWAFARAWLYREIQASRS